MPVTQVGAASHEGTRFGHERRLTAARIAVTVVFAVIGIGSASWFARIPAVQSELGLSNSQLGIALLGLPAGSLLTMLLAGGIVARTGSRPITIGATLAYCAVLPLPALAPSLIWLFVALVLVGAAVGAADVSMNAQSVALENLHGRPILSSFHAAFSLGGMAGALLGGAAASLGLSPATHLAIVVLVLACMVVVVARWLLPGDVDRHSDVLDRPPMLVRPPRALLALSVIGFCSFMNEGAVADWSAVYLRRVLDTSAGLAAAGFAAFSMAMTTGRLLGDWLTHRYGGVLLVRVGGLTAAFGILLAIVAPAAAPAILGFGLVGAGNAVIAPLVFGAAGRTPGIAPGPAIATLTTFGYLGFVIGPPIIGLAAEVVTLRGALGIVGLLALSAALLAGSVRR
jgi:predicted MFS family arabinose efflux permease